MKHNHLPLNLYRTPFTPAYWREASAAMSSLKLLVFAALMVAVTRALSMIPGIPIAHTKLTWGFLSRSLCALVCGPVMGLVFGFVEDILGFILHPTGDFSQAIPCQLWSEYWSMHCAFSPADHRGAFGGGESAGQPASECRTGVDLEHGRAGWSLLGLVHPKHGKNMVTILPKAAVLYFLFQALLPILQRMNLIPRQVDGVIRLI